MPQGAITGYVDVAQLALYAFWIFFAGLVIYLRREDKREGYPLRSDAGTRDRGRNPGFALIPKARTFLLKNGGTRTVPAGGRADHNELKAKRTAVWAGAPLQPTGDPMLAGVGPSAYAERIDEPELTYDGVPLIQPLRVLEDYDVAIEDRDPRGMEVIGADGVVAGVVHDLWVDRSEPQIRYLEVDVAGNGGIGHAMVPMTSARIHVASQQVKVASILARQFKDVPTLKGQDQITKLEEEKITAYFAGGKLYATPSRLGPIL